MLLLAVFRLKFSGAKNNQSQALNEPLYRYVINLKFSQSNPAPERFGEVIEVSRKSLLFPRAKRTSGRYKF